MLHSVKTRQRFVMWNYTEKVHDHFLHLRNAESLSDANAIGKVCRLDCGDALKLYLKNQRERHY